MKKVFIILGLFVLFTNVAYATKFHRNFMKMRYISYFNKKASTELKEYCSSQGRIFYIFNLEKACKINGGRYMLFNEKASIKKILSYLKGKEKYEKNKANIMLGSIIIFVIGGFIFLLIKSNRSSI